MRSNQLTEPGMNRTPNRMPRRALRCRTTRQRIHLIHPGHVFHRHGNPQIELLRFASVDNGHRSVRGSSFSRLHIGVQLAALHFRRIRHGPRSLARRCTSQESCYLFQGTLRCRKSDALQPTPAQMLEPLQRKREMRPAFGRHHGMNLIDDYRLYRTQRVAHVGSQH